MVWAMLSFVGEDWVLGLRRDLESIDGPAQVEVVMDLEAVAVCRSRAGRTEDDIFAQAVRRVPVTVGGRMQCWLDGFASTARAKSRYELESGVWRMSLPSSRGEADLVLSVPEVPKYFYNQQLCHWFNGSVPLQRAVVGYARAIDAQTI